MKHRIRDSTADFWAASMDHPVVSPLLLTNLGGEGGESQLSCWMELDYLFSVLGEPQHGMRGAGG